jgi:HSP20 family protein
MKATGIMRKGGVYMVTHGEKNGSPRDKTGTVSGGARTGFGAAGTLIAALDEMERVIEQTLHMPVTRWHRLPVRHLREGNYFVPLLDVVEEDSEIVVKVDLPGIKREAIDIRLVDGTLVVSGEKGDEGHEERYEYLRMERRHGPFHRTLRLPDTVDGDHVSATLADGVLEVHVPKSRTSLRHIPIE